MASRGEVSVTGHIHIFFMGKKLNLIALASSICAIALLVTGCSTGKTSNHKQSYNYTIAVVTHGSPDDSFWSTVKNGSEKAASDYGVHMNFYFTNNSSLQQATIINSEAAKNVDGIAVTLADPIPLKDALTGLKNKNIPLVSFNSGMSVYREYGSLSHIGQDDYIAGKQAGEEAKKNNPNISPLCIIHEANNISLQERCRGIKDAIGNAEILELNNKNPEYISQTVFSYITSHQKVNYLFSLSVPVTNSILSANNINLPISGFDNDNDLVKKFKKDKRFQFVVDQQPFLQGYLAVETLVLYRYNRTLIGSAGPILTGPKIIRLN